MRNKFILLTSDRLGEGDPELGNILLENFFTVLKQREELPAAIFCLNRGVFALTEESLAHVHLKEIEEQGVPVLACGTCVKYFGLEGKLLAGKVSGMREMQDLAARYEVWTVG